MNRLLTYLLDTNIVITLIINYPTFWQVIFDTFSPDILAISVITWGELYHGRAKSIYPLKSVENLKFIKARLPIYPLLRESGKIYGEIKADLERKGKVIGPNDLWIAAHAKSCGYVLVTHNTDEFVRVSDLKLDDWKRSDDGKRVEHIQIKTKKT